MAAAGCDEKSTQEEKSDVLPRAVKVFAIQNRADRFERVLSGIVIAAESAVLSFRADGQVEDMRVDVGDAVVAGQVLARLDTRPFASHLKAAAAELDKAQAELDHAERRYSAQSKLYEKKVVAKRARDRAAADRQTAYSAVQSAMATKELAESQLTDTTIRAPFTGVVARRDVSRFARVGAGVPVLEINRLGKLEVAVRVPEVLIAMVRPGLAVSLSATALPGRAVKGRVVSVSAHADAGRTFPVRIAFDGAGTELRPGMTMEASFSLADPAEQAGFLVPYRALLAGAEPNTGYVFRYQPGIDASASGTVERKPVVVAGTRGSLIEIEADLAIGDLIAVAGVGFLADGQTVRLFESAQY